MAYEELKQRQSVMWGTGPYQRVTETITDIHARVIEQLDPQPGRRRGSTSRAGPARSRSWRRRAAPP